MKLSFANQIVTLPDESEILDVGFGRLEFRVKERNIVYFFNSDGIHILTLISSENEDKLYEHFGTNKAKAEDIIWKC